MAELTGMLDLSSWPAGMRVIVRKERPHQGGTVAVHRPRRTATDRIRHQHHHRTVGGPGTTSPSPGRCEDRIRTAKDCGLRNLPLHGFDQNRIWCVIVELACGCWPGPRCSRYTIVRPAGGNPKRYDCFRSQHA